jgi:hypothetical protein
MKEVNTMPGASESGGLVTSITCTWEEWLDRYETSLSRHPIRTVKLLDWPEIDLPDTREAAALEIGKQFPGITFEVPDDEETDECVAGHIVEARPD